jgi:hypothetical protein
MEMGLGSQDLLNDLLSPETSTTDVDKLKGIEEEEEVVNTIAKPAKPKKNISDIEDEEEESPINAVDAFLNASDDDDEEEEEKPVPVKKAKAVKPIGAEPGEEEEEEEEAPKGGGTQFEALSNDLFELGIFSRTEGEEETPIATPEAFLERFQDEKKKGAMEMVDNFIGQFGQEYQDAFDSIFVKGLNPKDYFQTANQINDYTDLDLSIESNQESVMREALAQQEFEPEDIESEIERLKNYGDLESVSQKHHKVLIKKEAAALQQKTADAQVAQQQKAQIRQAYYNNVNAVLGEKLKEKEFDGIPFNPKTANELQDFLLVDKWKTDSGETLTDFDRYILELKRPENHATKVKVGLLLKLMEKDPTLSTIQKSGVTKKTNTLFKEVSRQVASTPGKTAAKAPSWFTK